MFRYLATVFIVVTLAVSADGQIKSLKRQKFPADGVSVKVPGRWDQIPPQPDEDDVVAKWAADTMKKGTGERYALRLMKFRHRGGVTGSAVPTEVTAGGRGDAGEEIDRAEIMRRWKERNRPVSFKDYWEKSFGYLTKLPKSKDIKIGKAKGKVYELDLRSTQYGHTSMIVGVVFDGTFEWAVIYEAPTDQIFPERSPSAKTKVKSKIYSSIKSLKFFDRERKNQKKGMDLDNLSEMDKKIEKIRGRLPKSWTIMPTPMKQYVVVHNIPQKKTKQIAFAKNIVKYLERMRKHYERVFPPKKQITAVSVVRVCQNREEYHQYGGPGGSAGYFSPSTGELVIYDATKDGGMADSYSTLFHEAYHQYLYYAVGETSAHCWFDEGYGDYFAGANPKKGFKIGLFDWRTSTVKKAVREGKNVHLKDLFTYTQPQYYANASICYAQGWALVYFLKSKTCKKQNKRWPEILDIYFNTMVKTGSAGKALAAAIDGVDLEELNNAYMKFIKKGFK